MSEIATLNDPTTAPNGSTANEMKAENDVIREKKLIYGPTAAKVSKRTEKTRKRKR